MDIKNLIDPLKRKCSEALLSGFDEHFDNLKKLKLEPENAKMNEVEAASVLLVIGHCDDDLAKTDFNKESNPKMDWYKKPLMQQDANYAKPPSFNNRTIDEDSVGVVDSYVDVCLDAEPSKQREFLIAKFKQSYLLAKSERKTGITAQQIKTIHYLIEEIRLQMISKKLVAKHKRDLIRSIPAGWDKNFYQTVKRLGSSIKMVDLSLSLTPVQLALALDVYENKDLNAIKKCLEDLRNVTSAFGNLSEMELANSSGALFELAMILRHKQANVKHKRESRLRKRIHDGSSDE